MKLTKQTLKRIIKEELNKVLNEKETLKEGSVAYIKDGTPSSDAHIFQREHKQGKSHLVNLSYSNEQDKRLRYEIEKQIKATAGIEDALSINVVFTL